VSQTDGQQDNTIVLVVLLALAGQTNSVITLDMFLPASGDRPSYRAMVVRRDGPSWLRDDDDDDDDVCFKMSYRS